MSDVILNKEPSLVMNLTKVGLLIQDAANVEKDRIGSIYWDAADLCYENVIKFNLHCGLQNLLSFAVGCASQMSEVVAKSYDGYPSQWEWRPLRSDEEGAVVDEDIYPVEKQKSGILDAIFFQLSRDGRYSKGAALLKQYADENDLWTENDASGIDF